jgi:hypothetical protein
MFPACFLNNRDADLFVFINLFRVKLTFILKKGIQGYKRYSELENEYPEGIYHLLETKKVPSHKNYPKYLEYSNQIHMDKCICNKNE